MARQPRKNASTEEQETVKISVNLRVDSHTKLAALAAMRRCSQSAIAAEAIEAAVSSIVVFDRSAKRAGRVDPTQEVIGDGEAA